MPFYSTFPRFVLMFAMVCGVGGPLVGCSKKDAALTQAVARVDGEEISVHQINRVLAKAQGASPEALAKAKIDILESLIDQQLAINFAISKKLDRSPEVVMAIENAKRDILSRAAVDHMTANLPKATDEEAKQYFAEHPALFSQRRMYSLQEIAFSADTPNMVAVRAKVAAAKSMDEMAAWLKEKKIPFSSNAGSRSAEQIPLEILPKLHLFKDGQIGLFEGKDGFFIMRLAASRLQPVTEDQALPRIKTFLLNQRSMDALKQERAQMKQKAKIEYLGEFVGGEVALKAKVDAQLQAKAQADASAAEKAKLEAQDLAAQKAADQARAQAEAQARSKARSDARAQSGKSSKPSEIPANLELEKGIKGLK